MRNFDFYSPTYFVFGKDREAETGRYVKRFGGSRVLVVYGGQSAKRSGLLDRIMACLKEENLYAVELGGVKPNPRSGLVCCGGDIRSAYSLACNLEYVAELQYRAMSIGKPNVLTEEQMAEVMVKFQSYGQPGAKKTGY